MINKLKKLLSTLIFSTIGGLLGSFGGADNTSKAWRRIGIPLVITLYALYTLHNWWVLSIMLMGIVLSIGYGIPDQYSPKGSTLGRFWLSIASKMGLNLTKTHLIANVLTRSHIGILTCLSLLSVPILGQNWLLYGLVSVGIITVYATISWRGLGTFQFKNKHLLVSEFTLYSVIVLLAQILIKY